MNLFYLCIITRLILVYIAKNMNLNNLYYLGYVTLLPAIGFMLIYLTNSRQTGIEVGGKRIWWNNIRPIHSILYFIFSIGAIYHYNLWYVLLIDVIVGIISYIIHYKIEIF